MKKLSHQKEDHQLEWGPVSIQALAILEKWVAPQDIRTMYSGTPLVQPQELKASAKNTDVSYLVGGATVEQCAGRRVLLPQSRRS